MTDISMKTMIAGRCDALKLLLVTYPGGDITVRRCQNMRLYFVFGIVQQIGFCVVTQGVDLGRSDGTTPLFLACQVAMPRLGSRDICLSQHLLLPHHLLPSLFPSPLGRPH